MTDLEKIIKLEGRFLANQYSGEASNPSFFITKGSRPILLSAPHSVNHPRGGTIKRADVFTGSLAMILSSITDSSAIVQGRTSQEDPNHDLAGPYKSELKKLVRGNNIRFVLDLHGLAEDREMELAIGTGLGKDDAASEEIMAIRAALVACAERHGFLKIMADGAEYNAGRLGTIASYVRRECGIPGLQLEIRKDYRSPRENPEKAARLTDFLKEFLLAIGVVG